MAPRRASEAHRRGSAAAKANEPTMDSVPPATIELSRPTSADAIPASSCAARGSVSATSAPASRSGRPTDRLGSWTSPGRRPAFSRAPPSQAEPRTGRSRFRCGRRQASPAAPRGLSQRPATRLDDRQKRQPARRNNALQRRGLGERRILDGAQFRRYRYARDQRQRRRAELRGASLSHRGLLVQVVRGAVR
jgi:hypothetical protein